MTKKKEYTGSVYIGTVGPDREPGEARDSIENILRRPGDEGPFPARATKGYEARQWHINSFIGGKHDFLLLLDHDMIIPADTLIRLLEHKLPFVSGLYMRRQYAPIAPVWFRPFAGKWPIEPWIGPVERGKLHPIGASGWGCMLIHREVILAVREILHGEWEVLEDDMDIWPYDLARVMQAIRALRELLAPGISPQTLRLGALACSDVLEAQIRPLTGAKFDIIGSDIRFPFFARAAGYQLMGDPDVRASHILDYPVSADDYEQVPEEGHQNVSKSLRGRMSQDRRKYQQAQEALNG